MFNQRSYLMSMKVLVVMCLMLFVSDTAKADYYKIQWGDTLSNLAIEFKTSTSKLVKINNIKNADLIYAGSTILLPTPTPSIDKQEKNNEESKEDSKSAKSVEKESEEEEEKTITLNNVVELNPYKKKYHD